MQNWVLMLLNSYSNSSPKILKLMYVARYVNLCREAVGCFHGDKVGKLKNQGRISIEGEVHSFKKQKNWLHDVELQTLE